MDRATEPAPDERQRALRHALIALAAYAVFRLLLALVRLPLGTPMWVLFLIAGLGAVGSIGLPALGMAALARARLPVRALALMAVVGLALWIGIQFTAPRMPPATWSAASVLQDLGMILAAAAVGLALGLAVPEPNILFPAGLFAAFADWVVVNFGTVQQALLSEGGRKLLHAVSAKMPTENLHPGLRPWSLTIGPADFLFLGLFLACAARFGMGVFRNAWILTAVLAVSLFLVPLIGPVPALAPMALAFVAANWRSFRLSRQELIGSVAVLLLAGALFRGYFLWMFPRK